jgi:hypothetical protein
MIVRPEARNQVLFSAAQHESGNTRIVPDRRVLPICCQILNHWEGGALAQLSKLPNRVNRFERVVTSHRTDVAGHEASGPCPVEINQKSLSLHPYVGVGVLREQPKQSDRRRPREDFRSCPSGPIADHRIGVFGQLPQ